jgi:predicted acetyltransferase
MAFYNAYAASHHTLVQRQHREWESRTALRAWSTDTAARGVVRFSTDSQVVGLMGYDLTRKAGEDQSTFNVNLMAYEEDAALRAMLRYVHRLSHQVKAVRFDVPPDCELWPYLNGRPEKTTIRDMFMIRIVSMGSLNGLSVDVPDLALEIEIEDDQAPWNAGIWRLSIESGTLHVTQGTHAALRCGIGALSSVLSGFSSFHELIAARKVDALDGYQGQDFAKTIPFLADYF